MGVPIEYYDTYAQLTVALDNNYSLEDIPDEDLARDEMYLLADERVYHAENEISMMTNLEKYHLFARSSL